MDEYSGEAYGQVQFTQSNAARDQFFSSEDFGKDVMGFYCGSPIHEGGHVHPRSTLDRQVGGGHYKDFAIQPVEFIVKNKLPFIEGNVIKYVCRHRTKLGRQDLEKAKHYLEMLIELEYRK